jgi:hypothetical protein
MGGCHWCVLVAALSCGSFAIAAEPAKSARMRQREAVEAILIKPAEWSPEDGKDTVSLEEFAAHVKQKHGLVIRWDAASFMAMNADVHSFPVATLEGPSEDFHPIPPYGTVVPAGAETIPGALPATGVEALTLPAGKYIPAALPADPVPTAGPVGPETGPPRKPAARPQPTDVPVPTDINDKPANVELASRQIHRSFVAIEGATVSETLSSLLAAVVPPTGGLAEDFGLPLPLTTQAMTLDYRVEGGAVVIMSALSANARKETRVYRISHLKGLPAEQVAKTICHSVRPWSWRSQATEIADRLAKRFPKGNIQLPQVSFSSTTVTDVIAPVSGEGPPNPGAAPAVITPPAQSVELKPQDLAGLGELVTGGAIAALEALVNTVEIVHHGDPPTAVMEVLPGVLVITQSQGAHREISALLEELADATQ